MTSAELDLVINEITVAHEYTLTMSQRCDYTEGRRVFGLCYAISGEAVYKFPSGEKMRFCEGDLFFLPSSIAYTAYSPSTFRHYSVNFTVSEPFLSEVFSENGITVLRSRRHEHYRAAFCDLVGLWQKKSVGYRMRAKGRIYEILSDMYSELCESAPKSSRAKRLMPARELLDKSYTEPLSIARLSRLVRMSETNFRREFLREFGKTPMRYRDELRMRYAKELLSSGYYNVSEVAFAVGMDNIGYFCRFFKRHEGLPPGEWAREHS